MDISNICRFPINRHPLKNKVKKKERVTCSKKKSNLISLGKKKVAEDV